MLLTGSDIICKPLISAYVKKCIYTVPALYCRLTIYSIYRSSLCCIVERFKKEENNFPLYFFSIIEIRIQESESKC